MRQLGRSLKIPTDIGHPLAIWDWQNIARQRATPANRKETFSGMGIAQVMGREESAAPALNVFSGYNCVAEPLELSLRHPPGTTTVMLLEVSDVLKENVFGLVLFKDGHDIVEQSPTSVELSILET